MPNPQFILHNKNSDTANLILHGGSKGIDSEFIQKIFTRSAKEGFTTLAFNFPYLDRGEENSSGDELIEEIETLKSMISLLKQLGCTNINLIGKSLGGIVASRYLQKKEEEDLVFTLNILGFVIGDVDVRGLNKPLLVIQGGNDRFGNIEEVKNNLKKQQVLETKLFGISNADHSYRNENKEPVFEDKAIKILFENLQ